MLSGGWCAAVLVVPLRGAFSFAPRAWSGRSGRASSPALRPAGACDRAGTPRAGAPRRSHEAAPATPRRGTPARFPHAPAPWLCGPRGGSHPRTPVRDEAVSEVCVASLGGWRRSARRVGRPCLLRPRAPGVRIRGGVSVTRLCLHADTEGPRPGPRCRVGDGGVSARREWGRASAERRTTRRAKQSHAVTIKNSARGGKEGARSGSKETVAPHPPGKKKPPRSGTETRADAWV